MHHPPVGLDAGTAELLERVGELAEPGRRQEAAAALARLLGAEGLLLFAPDPEMGVPLPAPGLSQVLRGAGEWRAFLGVCARQGDLSGTVPGPDGAPAPVRGCALPDGTAAVLVRPGPGATGPGPLRPLLPLLGALFRAERQVAADEVRARSAAEVVERARVLTRALQEMRQRLEGALVEAEDARAEAKRRAEEAELLAVELQAQADQLQEQTVELELLNDELATRTEEAERARAAADEANRAKSQFLANMSHELRTPINAVMGYAELLSMGITGPVTGEQQAQLERIRASSAHLLGLINDILDLSKVEAGQMTVAHEPGSVREVVAEAVALVEVQAEAGRLTLANECRDPGATYVGDRDRVRQVLVNLLSNAVKFTEPGGRVTVRVGTTEHAEATTQVAGEGPWTFVEVEDTGIGMAADQLARIFQPFVQAESGHTRTRGGTGLGLTISRQLARLMGGDLAVRSVEGRGSTFTLWLPAASPETGSLDPVLRVGAAAGVEPWPAGLARVGAILQAELPSITAAVAHRVRTEIPAGRRNEGELLDHAPVFVAEVAAILVKLGRSGGDPSLLREGSDVQRLLADKLGAARGRQGWPAEAVQRELEILREELVRTVRASMKGSSDLDPEGVIRVLDRLVQASQRTSLGSHGAAAAGAPVDPGRAELRPLPTDVPQQTHHVD